MGSVEITVLSNSFSLRACLKSRLFLKKRPLRKVELNPNFPPRSLKSSPLEISKISKKKIIKSKSLINKCFYSEDFNYARNLSSLQPPWQVDIAQSSF